MTDTTTGPAPVFPVLPYAGTSGYSNEEASRDATLYLDRVGVTAEAQRAVYGLLVDARQDGMTVNEAEDVMRYRMVRAGKPVWRHGRVSAALSNLHERDLVALLKERRGHCGVYVLPRWVQDRPTTPRRRNKPRTDDPAPAAAPVATDQEAYMAMLDRAGIPYAVTRHQPTLLGDAFIVVQSQRGAKVRALFRPDGSLANI